MLFILIDKKLVYFAWNDTNYWVALTLTLSHSHMTTHVLQDVFIVDSGDNVVVWVGKEASIEERKNAFAYAHVSGSFWNAFGKKCNLLSNTGKLNDLKYNAHSGFLK